MKSMGFVDAVKSVVVENYANFKGRARRSEYWYFCLASIIVSLVSLKVPILSSILGIALFIPNLAVCVRRLHDIGKSGWYLLLILIPIFGWFFVLYLFCLDSQPGENKWGANPKE